VRKAINENPVVQVVMLGALGIIVAFLFMTRVMGGDDSSGGSEATTATTPSPTTAGAAPVPAATPAVSAAPAPTVPATATTPGAAPAVGFEPGAGLPKSVVQAYDSGDVVAVLVVNRKAAEDRRLESEVNGLRGRGDTSVFVVEAKDVARYSRIAEGVNLDRVPALVVIEPKRQVEGDLPGATISYGFRGPESVGQAIDDSLYDGRELPYHPG
jgi:hypothetical protein